MDSRLDLIEPDGLGPSKTLILRDPRSGLRAFVVVDNTACGPSIGGIRMAPDVSIPEVARLARAMTFKNAAAGLPHGGGKAGIVGDPSMPADQKQALVRAFARSIASLTEYIPGPDMGLDERSMAYIHDEIGRAVGLPRVLGGIPLDEIGATGFGLAIAAEVAAPQAGIKLQDARVAVQGFGAVGVHAARFLADRGAILVAASDSHGGIYNGQGLAWADLAAHKGKGLPLSTFPGGQTLTPEQFVGVACDIWIPAARPDVLTSDNVGHLTARLVLQGANIPATPAAERWMHEHGVLNIPDFIANAGGVICASVEYHGGTESQAMTVIEERVRRNTAEVLALAKQGQMSPREAAVNLATARIEEAMRYRR